MENFVQYSLYFHALVGAIALLTGAVALLAPKGKTAHNGAGKIYFWAMTLVFVTGIFIAGYRFNRFLFFIAFLSYYSVFSGLRWLKLKQMHKGQRPEWYDWAAGGINSLVNLVFIGLGLYYLLRPSANIPGALLSIGFGVGGLAISYANLKSFFIPPKGGPYWYTAHLGNMGGAYIATFTAFLATMVSRYEFMNPYFAFVLPSLIGVPFLIYWTQRIERKFSKVKS